MARRSDHSRDEIQHMAIEAAIAILNRDGMQGLSTRKVARQIGYTVGTLYLVFRNLDELILHVNAATLDELHAVLQAATARQAEPHARLLAISHAYLHFAQTNFARWSLLFTHRLLDDTRLPDWFINKVRGLFALVAGPLCTLNPQLTAQACQQATHALWSAVHGVCELGLNDKLSLDGEIQAPVLIDAVVRNFLRGFVQGWE